MTPEAPRRPQSVWSLLADIGSTVVTIIKGHGVTLHNWLRPKVTVQYPHRDPDRDYVPAPGYRGDFALISNEERPGGLRCIGCMACANACPTQCIHIIADGKGKERHPVAFDIDTGLCMYCWMCVEVCPVAAITMTQEYHTVTYAPEALIRDIADLKRRGAGIPEPLLPVPVERSIRKPAAPKKTEE